MDCKTTNRLYDTPINKYELKCPECSFPDIDKIPEPYYIRKKFLYSNWEIFTANLGNIFVSARVKEILTLFFQDEIDFRPVYCEKTNIKTKWWLGIIKNQVITSEIKDEIPRCPSCNEPLHWHPGSQSKFWLDDIEAEYDMVKSKNWNSINEKDWKLSWIDKDTFFSKRLLELLKRLKVKGVYQYLDSSFKKMTKEEKDWIDLKMEEIPAHLKLPQLKIYDDESIIKIAHQLRLLADIDESKEIRSDIKIKNENNIISTFLHLKSPLLLTNNKDFMIRCTEEWQHNSAMEGQNKLY